MPLRCVPPVSGHPSYNLVVAAEGNVYFLEIFDNSLLEVTPDGQVSQTPSRPSQDLEGVAVRQGLDSLPTTGEEASRRRYVAPGSGQRFRLLKFSDPKAEPVELFVSMEGDEDFVDLHRGTMLVARDGTEYFSGAHRIWKVRGDRKLQLVAGAVERGYEDGTLKEARFDQVYALGGGPKGRLYAAELGGTEGRRECRVRVLSEEPRHDCRENPHTGGLQEVNLALLGDAPRGLLGVCATGGESARCVSFAPGWSAKTQSNP